ncbi:MFS transporter, partial [Streptomyces acidiscabies]|uniref:MFS transporter n=2 Tax=Bacteria TaxID=2 RepID=UPI0038F75E2C
PGLLGAVLGPPLLVALAEAYGWRAAFYLSCLPGLLIAWLVWRHVREPAPAPAPAGRGGGFASLLAERNILLCVLIACSY